MEPPLLSFLLHSPPQQAAPVGQVAALPSVPVVPASSRPKSGPLPALNGYNSSPPSVQKTYTTAPATPAALAQAQAEHAQSQRFSLRQAPRSFLPWVVLGVLLMLAAVLLIWVFVSA